MFRNIDRVWWRAIPTWHRWAIAFRMFWPGSHAPECQGVIRFVSHDRAPGGFTSPGSAEPPA